MEFFNQTSLVQIYFSSGNTFRKNKSLGGLILVNLLLKNLIQSCEIVEKSLLLSYLGNNVSFLARLNFCFVSVNGTVHTNWKRVEI